VAQASRAEAGCLGYALYADTESEHDFVFVEEWDGEEALQRHFGTDHIREFMSAVRPLLSAPPDVRFHTVTGSRDLSEVAGS
jgi:quinol monooxygenase YgiN